MLNPFFDINQLTYQIEKRDILYKISLRISAGDFIVVLGSNGSGKSTLLQLIQGKRTPTSGAIHIAEDLRRKIVFLSQTSTEQLCLSMTIAEHIRLYQPQQKPRDLLDYLHTFNPNLPKQFNTPVRFLSGGEKQALVLALILLSPPELLLLDEHTSALDPKTANTIMELTQRCIQKYNITCIMTTHELQHATQYGNRVIALKNGRIICDYNSTEKQLLTKQQLVAECY